MVTKEPYKSTLNHLVQSSINSLLRYENTPPIPCYPRELDPYFYDLFISKMLEAITFFETNSIPLEEIAKKLRGPSTIRIETLYFLFCVKYLKLVPKKVKRVLDFYLRLLEEMCLEDPTALSKNLAKETPDFANMQQKFKEYLIGPKDYRLVGTLKSSGCSLVWALYSDLYCHAGYEVFGPYPLAKASQAILWNFFDLKPEGLWEKLPTFKGKNLKILQFIRKGVPKFDLLNHITYSASFDRNSVDSLILLDNNPIHLDEIKPLNKSLENAVEKQFKACKALSFEETKQKYVFQKHYPFKGLFAFAGMDWKPSNEELERVKGKKLFPRFFKRFEGTKEDKAKQWTKLLHPMHDFSEWLL